MGKSFHVLPVILQMKTVCSMKKKTNVHNSGNNNCHNCDVRKLIDLNMWIVFVHAYKRLIWKLVASRVDKACYQTSLFVKALNYNMFKV